MPLSQNISSWSDFPIVVRGGLFCGAALGVAGGLISSLTREQAKALAEWEARRRARAFTDDCGCRRI